MIMKPAAFVGARPGSTAGSRGGETVAADACRAARPPHRDTAGRGQAESGAGLLSGRHSEGDVPAHRDGQGRRPVQPTHSHRRRSPLPCPGPVAIEDRPRGEIRPRDRCLISCLAYATFNRVAADICTRRVHTLCESVTNRQVNTRTYRRLTPVSCPGFVDVNQPNKHPPARCPTCR